MPPCCGLPAVNMAADKQTLLKRHRFHKRIGVAMAAVVILSAGVLVWWLPIPLSILAWIAHEVWFSDHVFYPPRQDYCYGFPQGVPPVAVTLGNSGEILLDEPVAFGQDDTLFLALRLKSSLLGRFFDPAVVLVAGDTVDAQVFERNAGGLRYVNLTGFAGAIQDASLRVVARRCRLADSGQLYVFKHPNYLGKRVLVVSPHADDAELAAFGLYSRARESWIVTLTVGEVEAGHYRRMGFSPAAAALLKGRLRAWDSVAVPRWGGVPAENCLQLGYFCMQLPAMQASPDKSIGSREADLCATRPFRGYNRIALPGDSCGLPTWNSLKADLLHIVELVKPEVIVLPHPGLDPHPDHVSAYELVTEILADSGCRPETLLCYANHLHNNDRWPMGEVHSGVPLPPLFEGVEAGIPCCLVMPDNVQHDKAMALGMMHDLLTPLPLKKRLRRCLQASFSGRRWPAYGENEFFRKAVRRHELFWVYPLS